MGGKKRKSKAARGAGGAWDGLPWKSLDVPLERDDGWTGGEDGALVCSVEEIDGSAYVMEKSGGGAMMVRALAQGDGSEGNRSLAHTGKKRKAGMSTVVDEDAEQDRDPGIVADDSSKQPTDKKQKKKKQKKRKKPKQECEPVATAGALPSEEDQDQPSSEEKSWELTEEAAASMLSWSTLGLELHPIILFHLSRLGFLRPTPIQQAALPKAILGRRDIIAAAETGSGKTLSYAIPILQSILACGGAGKGHPLQALILCPTRELAMQVVSHTQAVCEGSGVQVVAVVGGMAEVKQERLLKRRPEIVVATPGRLWELIQTNAHMGDLSSLKFLVIDEADRMIEPGRYSELKKLLTLLASSPRDVPLEVANAAQEEESSRPTVKRQTFVLSATLALGSASRQKKRKKPSPSSKRPQKTMEELDDGEDAMKDIMRRAGVSGKPAILDLTQQQAKHVIDPHQSTEGSEAPSAPPPVLPQGLQLSSVKSLQMDKDTWLYLFLVQYGGRKIVFLNSIKLVRRLAAILGLLNVPCCTLHAQMQQKQRLKSVERLQAEPNAVLLATDVAARGLDIQNVEHVIHYDVPRSADTFIHRSGRTARGGGTGFVLTIVSPHDENTYKKLCEVLQKPMGLDSFSSPLHLLDRARERVSLAVRVARFQARQAGQKAESTMLEKTAEAADLLPDDEMLDSRAKGSRHEKQLAMESARKLKTLLALPLYTDRRKIIPAADVLREAQRAAAAAPMDMVKIKVKR